MSSLEQSAGSIGKPAWLSLSFTYAKVSWATLNSTGKPVSSYCFDVATNAAC